MNVETLAAENAEKQIESVEVFFDSLSEKQIRIMKIAFKEAYLLGHIHGVEVMRK